MVLTFLPPAHTNKNETLQLKTDRKLKTANEKGRLPHSKSNRSPSYKNSTSYKQIKAPERGRCVAAVSLVPLGLSSSSCTNLSYPTQGKRAILLKGSSVPPHLANTFSKAQWTTLCSNLPKTLLVLGNFVLLSRAWSLSLWSTAAGRPRLWTVFTVTKYARVLLIITGIYPKGTCSPELC